MKSYQEEGLADSRYDRTPDLKYSFFRADFRIHSIDTAEFDIYSQVQKQMGIDERDWVSS